MPEWKIADRRKRYKAETRITQENVLEDNLDEKIVADPQILGEPFLLIGRQIFIPDTNNKLDFLALDPRGNSVIIELKRKNQEDASDIHALRFANYISKWSSEDFEKQARTFYGKDSDAAFNFNALFESFCEDSGAEKIPDINKDQRLVITGSDINDKLSSFALWLKEHGIHITVVELHAYKDEDMIMIQPNFLVQVQPDKISEIEESQPEEDAMDTKWKTWHLEKRCSPETKEMCLKIDKILHDNFDLEGPRWNQKSYITYPIKNYDWLCITTTASVLRLDFVVKIESFSADDIAKTLKITQFDNEEVIPEQPGSPSSVFIKNLDEGTDRVQIRIKEDFDLESDRFLVFLEEAYRASPK